MSKLAATYVCPNCGRETSTTKLVLWPCSTPGDILLNLSCRWCHTSAQYHPGSGTWVSYFRSSAQDGQHLDLARANESAPVVTLRRT